MATNIGRYHGRYVYKVEKNDFLENYINDGTHNLYALIETGELVSGDTVIGRVNWRTMDVEDYDPKDFVSVRNEPKKKEVKSSYEAPAAPEYSTPTGLNEAELDAILDNAMHGSVVGGIDLDDIGTIGDLDVGDNYRPSSARG